MKRVTLLAAVLCLLLAGCGQGKPAARKPEQTPAAPTAAQNEVVQQHEQQPAAEENRPTAEELGRPEKTELKFLLEGMEETLSATLHVGQGYSLYIPDEGWRLDDRDREDGVWEETWESTINDDAELWVLSLGTRTLEEGQAWLRAEEDDYTFQEDKQGGLWGSDPEDRTQMEVRFHSGEDALYAVVCTYPESAAEGFGTRLSVLADTFERTP